MPSLSAKSLRSCPEAKCALRKAHGNRRRGFELFQHGFENRLDESGVHLDIPNGDADDLAPLTRR